MQWIAARSGRRQIHWPSPRPPTFGTLELQKFENCGKPEDAAHPALENQSTILFEFVPGFENHLCLLRQFQFLRAGFFESCTGNVTASINSFP